MTQDGGSHERGTIFNYNVSTGEEAIKYDFNNNTDGAHPYGSLTQASNRLLYGMTDSGGVYGKGIIFSYNISDSAETDLHDFGSNTDGTYPFGSLIQANNGLLYGMTSHGGVHGKGIIFSYNILDSTETDLHDFDDTDGQYPYGSLIQASDSMFYGMTSSGGLYNYSTIFSFNILTNQETDIHDFGSEANDGSFPSGSLLKASNGLLYGMTPYGGYGFGTLFSYNILTDTETVLSGFGTVANLGLFPFGSLIQVSDSLLYGMTFEGGTGTNGEGIIFSYNIFSDSEKVLHNFGNGSDGANPEGSLLLASNGLLYGTTIVGGTNGWGIILSYDTSTGTENDIYAFSSIQGYNSMNCGNLIEVDISTGINQLSSNNQLTIYPNPSNGAFTIKSTKIIDALKVTNLLGQVIYTAQPKQTQCTFNIGATGMYFVTVTADNETETKKVVVAK
jgi:uncharacterized repeat protein (TIGR03803 family)